MARQSKITSKALLFYRKRKKQSQEWLAEQVGVTQNTIHRWETGDIPKRWQEYAAVCEALDIEQVDLLSRESKDMYSLLLVRYEEALIDGTSLEIARLSAQVLNWERFFTTGKFGDEELTDEEIGHSSETERELAEMLRGKN